MSAAGSCRQAPMDGFTAFLDRHTPHPKIGETAQTGNCCNKASIPFFVAQRSRLRNRDLGIAPTEHPAPCGSDAFVAISKPLMFNIRRLIKQHRFQVYDDLCLASLPIFVYNGERSSVGIHALAAEKESVCIPTLERWDRGISAQFV